MMVPLDRAAAFAGMQRTLFVPPHPIRRTIGRALLWFIEGAHAARPGLSAAEIAAQACNELSARLSRNPIVSLSQPVAPRSTS